MGQRTTASARNLRIPLRGGRRMDNRPEGLWHCPQSVRRSELTVGQTDWGQCQRPRSARKVCVAGNFNNWRPEATEMIPTGGGKWAKELRLQPGTYEYRFVVDGEWTTDPKASGTVPNPFGDLNSLLAKRIGDSARGLDRREKYALPVTSTTGDRKQPR